MAFVSGGFFWSVTLVDNGGNEATKTYQLNSPDAATAATDAAAMFIALLAVTNAVAVSHFVYQKMVQDALVLPASGVQVEDNALLSFTIDGNPTKTATHSIPAPAPTIFNTTSGPGANIVNTAQAQLAAYAAKFITGANQIAFLSDGETMGSIDSGKRIHRKSRRG